jgi:hypothetical protein
MKHGLCINIVEGQSPTLLATGISRSAIHDLAIDLLVATRKGDREEMVESITLAFQSGVDAEVRRREQQEELRAMEECGVGLSPQTDG